MSRSQKSRVMAGQEREARLRVDVPAIHVFISVEFFGVDARGKPGHDANYFNGLLTKP
jgi:hypothetical protein